MKNEPKNTEFARIRQTGEIIHATVNFLRSHWQILLKLTFIYVFPFMVLYSVNQLSFQLQFADSADIIRNSQPENLISEMGGLYQKLFVTLLFSIFVQSLLAGVTYSYIRSWIFREGETVSEHEVSSSLFGNSLKAILAGLGVALLSGIGFIFFILPGIFILNSLSLALFIAIFEDNGPGQAISRSWSLVKRNWWGTLMLNLTGLVTVWMISIVLTSPFNIGEITGDGISAPGEFIPSDWRIWLLVLFMALSSLASVIHFIFLAFQYFSLSEREKLS